MGDFFEKSFKWVVLGLAVIAILYLARTTCSKSGVKEVSVTTKGKSWHPIDMHRGIEKETVEVSKIVYQTKVVVKLKTDTVHHWHTGTDLFEHGGLKLMVVDTLQGDSIKRSYALVSLDTVKILSRVDTLRELRVDTIRITKKGLGTKRFVQGFAAGFVIGFSGGVAVTK
jgi:hypothetical protein